MKDRKPNPVLHGLLRVGIWLAWGVVIFVGMTWLQRLIGAEWPDLQKPGKGVPRRAPLPPRA